MATATTSGLAASIISTGGSLLHKLRQVMSYGFGFLNQTASFFGDGERFLSGLWRNCGASKRLPWPPSLASCFEPLTVLKKSPDKSWLECLGCLASSSLDSGSKWMKCRKSAVHLVSSRGEMVAHYFTILPANCSLDISSCEKTPLQCSFSALKTNSWSHLLPASFTCSWYLKMPWASWLRCYFCCFAFAWRPQNDTVFKPQELSYEFYHCQGLSTLFRFLISYCTTCEVWIKSQLSKQLNSLAKKTF